MSTATSATSPASAAALPLRHRLYARYCDGASATALAREFALDRQTVTRHLRVLEEQLSREHTADLARLRIRAVQAQYRIQSTALDALAHEETLEATSLAAIAAAHANGTPPPPLYRAQRARLLAVAAHAARTAAQMEGLFTQPSAALVTEKPWLDPMPYSRSGAYAMRRPPDPAPDWPDGVYDPTDPDDQPDDDEPPDDQMPDDEMPDGVPPAGSPAGGDPASDKPSANPPADPANWLDRADSADRAAPLSDPPDDLTDPFGATGPVNLPEVEPVDPADVPALPSANSLHAAPSDPDRSMMVRTQSAQADVVAARPSSRELWSLTT